MTREERELRVKALDLLVLATNYPDAEERIALLLGAWFKNEAERAGRACLYVAKEWRSPDVPVSAEGLALRERSAEAAELCAYRVAPWLRTVPPSSGEKT